MKKKKVKQEIKAVRHNHSPEIPETELINCLKFYTKKATKENIIISLNNFFKCSWFKITPGTSLREAYANYLDKVDEKQNFS